MDILFKDITKANLQEKLLKAIEIVDESNEKLAKQIRKRQGYKTSNVKVQEQLESEYVDHYENLLDQIMRGLSSSLGFTITKAEGDIFRIKGKIFYNPKTGKPLTKKEWRLIKESISKFLGDNTKDLDEKLATEQQSLGSILQRMEAQGVRVRDITPAQIKDHVHSVRSPYEREYDWFADELYPLDLSMERLGENITGINEQVRKDIVTVINDGIVNRKTTKEVSRDLLERMGNKNRDWERLIAYESQYNFQVGYLNSLKKITPPTERIYVQAVSQPDACRFCRALLNGRIYILTGDESLIDSKPKDKYAVGYTMLGGTNVGNRPANYQAVIPLHCFCRCRWVQVFPEEFAQLEAEYGTE